MNEIEDERQRWDCTCGGREVPEESALGIVFLLVSGTHLLLCIIVTFALTRSGVSFGQDSRYTALPSQTDS